MARNVTLPDEAARALPPEPGQLAFHDAGHGCDAFGMSPVWIRRAVRAMRPLYRRYFRVTSHDAHNLPATGAAILAANHSGTLPLDATMLYMDVLAHTRPPRVARPIADLFVPQLPFVGTFFARTGVVKGTRANFRRLLEGGELVMVFPEGTEGISKPIWERYRLQTWHVGHAELALRHQVPVIPVGIVGAEEQWPQVGRLDVHLFGAPFLPLVATPLPLPVRYHVHYGEPIHLHRELAPEEADDPEVVARAAAAVRAAVERLIRRGLARRKGIFR